MASRWALRWAGREGRTVGVGELVEVDGEEERFGPDEDAVGGLADGFDPELAIGAVSQAGGEGDLTPSGAGPM